MGASSLLHKICLSLKIKISYPSSRFESKNSINKKKKIKRNKIKATRIPHGTPTGTELRPFFFNSKIFFTTKKITNNNKTRRRFQCSLKETNI
jgi:hypothetical protein